jgi:Domain of unknown function (DUF6434)
MSNALYEALLFFNIQELRETCKELSLPFSGLKRALVQRIVSWVTTGRLNEEAEIPTQSKARRGVSYPLHLETLILHGNYRNDAKTRHFLKGEIGEHFHFSAAGIDWIKEHWAAGDPPTYREFIEYWKEQHKARQENGSPPKEEWAFIRFTQAYIKANPTALREKIMRAWHTEREDQVQKAKRIIRDYLAGTD